VNLLTPPDELVDRVAAGVTRAIRTIAASDLVAVDLVYSGFDPDDHTPSDVDICACTRARREEILADQPPPAGVVYIWSNLEFDAYVEIEEYERHLATPWHEVFRYAETFKGEIDQRPDELDDTWVPRSVLIAACRRLNAGLWHPERPPQLASEAVIYPAARGGVDPDTPDNLRAVLSQAQRQRLDPAGLLPT
jgi:hypothetical protein